MTRYKFLSGDTVKITGKFKDFNGDLVDPTSPMLNVYNSKYKLFDTVNTEETTKESVGIYSTEYTLPDVLEPTEIIFE